MTAEFKPQDCAAPCKYPAVTLPTGSGHSKDCPAHERWINNGRTWRPPQPGDEYKHAPEAQGIASALVAIVDQLDTAVEREFVERKAGQLERYGARTFVSDREIAWLRGLKEKYL